MPKIRFGIWHWAFAIVFIVLATLNSAGYRYGASDQAFYIPAVLRHVDPALFPQDRVLIDAQARPILARHILSGEGQPPPGVDEPHGLPKERRVHRAHHRRH